MANLRNLISIAAILIAAPLGAMAAGPRLIESVEFDDTPLSLALDFIRSKSAEIDPNGRSLNILLDPKVDAETPITLDLNNVPVSAVLGYVIEAAGADYNIKNGVIYIQERDAEAAPKKRKAAPDLIVKARGLHLAQIEFNDTSLADVVGFLASRSAEIDPEKVGLNFVLAAGIDPETSITFRLDDVPMSTVLGYVADLAGAKLQPDKWAIVFQPMPSEPVE
ncbi:MAG: hypothetical protein ACI8UO_002084 [Verrucomicrobiales bacterium]|jgi:hypothetical protein